MRERGEDEPNNLALSKLVIPLILAFTEPSCRLQISVKSLERKEGTFLATKTIPRPPIFPKLCRRKYLIYFCNDIEPNQRIAIVQFTAILGEINRVESQEKTQK